MKTDHWFYGLFQSAPDLVALLLPQGASAAASLGPDAPGDALYRFEAPELKAANHRLDGAFWPRSGDTGTPEQPVVLLEVQMHAKAGFKHRLFAQSARFLQLHPQVQHLAVVVVVPHRRLKLGPTQLPQQLQAFLDGVIWLSLEELGQQADLDPLLALLTLSVRPESELMPSSQQILVRRPDLFRAVQTILLERLPLLTREDLMEIATIPAKDLRHTRVAQEWIEEGRLEGEAQGEARGRAAEAAAVPFANSAGSVASSATPLPPKSKPCRWSSWRPLLRSCSISAGLPIWQLGWKSTRAEARALAGLQFVRCPLVQQERGFRGPNPLGRCHPLAVASEVPLNQQPAHQLDQQNRRPLRSHRRRCAGGGRLLEAGGGAQHLAAAPHQRPRGAAAVWHRVSSDTRESPAIRICRDLLEEGAQLAIFDPKVSAEQIAGDLGVEPQAGSDGEGIQCEGVWQPAADPFADFCGADAVLLLTEWQQIRQLDWPALAAV